MTTTPRPWTVLPHGPLEKLEDNLWTADSALPMGHMRRRMAVVKRSDGRLVFHNAVPLGDAEMKQLEAWGEPGFLLVSNGYHRLDVHAFKQRYPGMKVLCPAPHDARVRQAVAVDGHYDALPPDAALRVEVLDGSRIGEGAFIVTSGPRVTLLLADTLMNIPNGPGLDILLFRLIGSVGDLRVSRLGRLITVSDAKALRRHLERLAELPGLARLIPTHGNVLGVEVPAALRHAASWL